MHPHDNGLVVKAGPKALRLIRDEGLRPERVRVMAGAAGGPKWLVLYHLDRALFGTFFTDRSLPLHLVGASIGAWRFAALAQANPLDAIERFRRAYIHQSYTGRPTAADVTAESRRIMDVYLPDHAVPEILNHAWCRLNILAVRCRHLTALENRLGMGLGLAGAVFLNLIGRRCLGLAFERALFHDPRGRLPLRRRDTLPFARTPLRPENVKHALLASGSIPLVMSGVSGIAGARQGVYRDGGMIDYHLDLPYAVAEDELVLMPHYADAIIPGWLDKNLRWRRPAPINMESVVLIAPSRDFVQRLPNARIPDRTDFHHYFGRDRERMAAWNRVVDLCRPPAEAFMEGVASGRIREKVQPID